MMRARRESTTVEEKKDGKADVYSNYIYVQPEQCDTKETKKAIK